MKRPVLACLICLLVVTSARAQGRESPAKVFSLQGTVTIEREGSVIQATESMELLPGDEISVGDPGRVALQTPDGSYIRLAAGSKMRFPAKGKEVGLIDGAMHFFSHTEQHPTIVTEHVTAAIRGTEFTLVINKHDTKIAMLSGSVHGTSVNGEASLAAGQGARFRNDRAPEVFALLASERSVQWSAFVPFLSPPAEETKDARLSKARTLVEAGRIKEAIAALPRTKSGCAQADILRAQLEISAGSIERGADVLQRCAATAGDKRMAGEAAAQLALVKLTQGSPEEAEALSGRAAEGAPQSPATRFARSLVLQEKGDLEAALDALGEPTGDTDDLAARRAELLFMFGRVPEARAILEEIKHRSWYAESVLGFVLMGDREFEAAESAFNRAARSEPGAGLPQLGLGIVKVSRGELDQGRNYFERATVLEPSRALYRSYLAKSYFEADTYAPAEPEYERAIELDKNDPTPHLYRSFMRLAQNRPVDALRDLETARDLSEKRSVYRSQFLLDEDSAVQSASLSRVYKELGLESRGRIEAISALYDDYENASAHRLLAETQDQFFTATSGLSERRMADLFAPLSINVADSIGTSVSLNEYSALFERDGWRTGVSAGYSSYEDTFVTGIMSANKSGNVVTGLSATGVGTDGFVDDPRSNEGRVGISLQGQPSWANRYLVEARGTFFDNNQVDNGDNFASGQAAGSFLHRFSPKTTAIVQSSFRRGRDRVTNGQADQDIFFRSPDGSIDEVHSAVTDQATSRYVSATENELQLIDRTSNVTSILTGRYSVYDTQRYDSSLVLSDDAGILDDAGVTFLSNAPVPLTSSSVSYLSNVRFSPSISVNLGGEYSHLEYAAVDEPPFTRDSQTLSRLIPKAGFIYKPDNTVMVRVGYGESLGKATQTSLVSLEPTLVGGITQRYNDNPGIQSRVFGTGIDLHPVRSTYVGAEWDRRWLNDGRFNSAYQLTIDPMTGQAERDVIASDRFNVSGGQDILSTYAYHVLNERFVFGTDYKYVMSTTNSPDDLSLRDHIVKSFGRYFFDNMFYFQSSALYRYQGRLNSYVAPNGSSSGWSFDAHLGYRLPTRQGTVTAGVRNILGNDFVLDQSNYYTELIFNDPVFELAAKFNF